MTPKQAEEAKAARKRASLRSDLLYISGALVISIGVGLIRIPFGVITAGGFLVFTPMLELAGSFLKGLRASRRD